MESGRGPVRGAKLERQQLATIERRLKKVVGCLPDVEAAMVGDFAGPFESPPTLPTSSQVPYWLWLPICLYDAWQEASNRDATDDLLTEMLWGQYGLFLFIRIQDDLLDAQARGLGLQFVANRFLVQSLESFQRVVELGPDFWGLYRSCLRETSEAILKVHRLQQQPGAFGADQLYLHAKVSAVFKVGVAGVCHLVGRHREMDWVFRLADQLAIMGQIGDDFADVSEDLEAGQFTFVINALGAIQTDEQLSSSLLRQRLAHGLARPSHFRPISMNLRRCAQEARLCPTESAPDSLRGYLDDLGAESTSLEDRMHEARVRWVFPDPEVLSGLEGARR